MIQGFVRRTLDDVQQLKLVHFCIPGVWCTKSPKLGFRVLSSFIFLYLKVEKHNKVHNWTLRITVVPWRVHLHSFYCRLGRKMSSSLFFLQTNHQLFIKTVQHSKKKFYSLFIVVSDLLIFNPRFNLGLKTEVSILCFLITRMKLNQICPQSLEFIQLSPKIRLVFSIQGNEL